MATTRKTKRAPVAPALPPETILADVRHSLLGIVIEGVDTDEAEQLYLRLRDTDPRAATILRMLLEDIDSVIEAYNEVR